MAAKNKYQSRAKAKNTANAPGFSSARRSVEPFINPEGKEETELVVAANVMRLGGYQADPLAATMNTRSMGLTRIP